MALLFKWASVRIFFGGGGVALVEEGFYQKEAFKNLYMLSYADGFKMCQLIYKHMS